MSEERDTEKEEKEKLVELKEKAESWGPVAKVIVEYEGRTKHRIKTG